MRPTILIAALAAMAAASAAAQEPYFTSSELPNGVAVLPAPPDTTSVEYAADMSRYFWGRGLRDTERGEQAVNHANGVYTHICKLFSPAFGLTITPAGTPAIYTLVANALKTTSNACSTTKSHYRRRRPFQTFGDPLGTGETLGASSYPSSHAAKGWMVALLLTELNPAAQNELLRLGYEYGESRVIVGAHWQSDVDAARLLGSSALARMHTSRRFLDELEAARQEFAGLTAGHVPPATPAATTATPDIGDDEDDDRWYTITGAPATATSQGVLLRKGEKRVQR